LSEVAAFLRVDQAAVLTLIEEQSLPARKIGEEWRFMKTAIQDWLSSDPVPDTSKAAQLAVVGAWKDDPLVDEELREIYRRRRPAENDR
jgi:excisionase family DNA binding protein